MNKKNGGLGRRSLGERGFTLIELLVVIVIILLLIALLSMFIKGLITRSRNAKTHGIVKTLDTGCHSYHTDFGVFPPMGLYGAGSQNLHGCLGSERVIVAQNTLSGPAIKDTKGPIMEFKKDQLFGSPNNTSPGPGNYIYVVDAWGNIIQYLNPGVKNPKGFDIWSQGNDTADPVDDLGNWIREY